MSFCLESSFRAIIERLQSFVFLHDDITTVCLYLIFMKLVTFNFFKLQHNNWFSLDLLSVNFQLFKHFTFYPWIITVSQHNYLQFNTKCIHRNGRENTQLLFLSNERQFQTLPNVSFQRLFQCDVRKYKMEQKLYDKRENMSIL